MDRVGVAAMLAADPNFHVRPGLAPFADSHCHEPANTVHVDGFEGVSLQDPAFEIAHDEVALGVVARITERRLGEVVGAEGEKLGVGRDLAGRERRARKLDHRAEPVGHGHALLLLDGVHDGP